LTDHINNETALVTNNGALYAKADLKEVTPLAIFGLTKKQKTAEKARTRAKTCL
jgi:hypothetical protein